MNRSFPQPYENHVEKAQSTLLAFLEARDEDHVLEVTDLELPFNEDGHGLVALTVYEDVEITSDILNGCSLRTLMRSQASLLTRLCEQTPSSSISIARWLSI